MHEHGEQMSYVLPDEGGNPIQGQPNPDMLWVRIPTQTGVVILGISGVQANLAGFALAFSPPPEVIDAAKSGL